MCVIPSMTKLRSAYETCHTTVGVLHVMRIAVVVYDHRPLASLKCRDAVRRAFAVHEDVACIDARSALRTSASRAKGDLHPTTGIRNAREAAFVQCG